MYVLGPVLAVEKGASFRIRSSAPVYDQDPNLPCMNPYLSILLKEQAAFWVEEAGSRNGEEKTLEEIRRIVYEKRDHLHRRYEKYGFHCHGPGSIPGW